MKAEDFEQAFDDGEDVTGYLDLPKRLKDKNVATGHEIIKLIRDNRGFLSRHGVKRMGLFGSFARGEQRTDSDVDLIVEFCEGQKNYDNFIEVCFFLEDILGRKVDLLTQESISPFLRPYIEKEVRYEVIH